MPICMFMHQLDESLGSLRANVLFFFSQNLFKAPQAVDWLCNWWVFLFLDFRYRNLLRRNSPGFAGVTKRVQAPCIVLSSFGLQWFLRIWCMKLTLATEGACLSFWLKLMFSFQKPSGKLSEKVDFRISIHETFCWLFDVDSTPPVADFRCRSKSWHHLCYALLQWMCSGQGQGRSACLCLGLAPNGSVENPRVVCWSMNVGLIIQSWSTTVLFVLPVSHSRSRRFQWHLKLCFC